MSQRTLKSASALSLLLILILLLTDGFAARGEGRRQSPERSGRGETRGESPWSETEGEGQEARGKVLAMLAAPATPTLVLLTPRQDFGEFSRTAQVERFRIDLEQCFFTPP